jgi:hypothetical protein
VRNTDIGRIMNMDDHEDDLPAMVDGNDDDLTE